MLCSRWEGLEGASEPLSLTEGLKNGRGPGLLLLFASSLGLLCKLDVLVEGKIRVVVFCHLSRVILGFLNL